MIAINDLTRLIGRHCMVKSLKVLPKGHLRIQTRFAYVDGRLIDIFADRTQSLLKDDMVTLTDFGQTFAVLDESCVRPWTSPDRLKMMTEAVESLGCHVERDRIVRHVACEDELPDAINDLGQACVRASCMVFTKRATRDIPFVTMVRDFIAETGLDHKEGFEHDGPYGRPVRVDFRVIGQSTASSILSLSGVSRSAAHNQANEIFARWTDLHEAKSEDKFITVYDDRLNTHRAADLRRLEKVSDVVPFGKREELRKLIAA